MKHLDYLTGIFLLPGILTVPASAESIIWGGHTKYQLSQTRYDDDSLFSSVATSPATDQTLDFRLKAQKYWGSPWDATFHYQLLGLHGDTLVASRSLPVSPFRLNTGAISDQQRLFDLTSVISERDDRILLHRIDRLSLGYSGEQFVARAGRHIVSWGNGLIYNPMDFFNPFDPAAIDKSYKTGDDMFYTQWLTQRGNDLQGVLVPRRELTSGNVSSDQSSLVFKYHAAADLTEYDLLAARHYDDSIMGGGLAFDWRGSVIRSDLISTYSDRDLTMAFVASTSYAWSWLNRNISGLLEYYYNGFGQADGDYSVAALTTNTALLARISRGELFTLGRNYLAAGATIEITPLTILTPTLFTNLDDGSALLQLLLNYDIKQDFNLLAGFTLPIGPTGTEYGGIPSRIPGIFLSPGSALFAKLSWHF